MDSTSCQQGTAHSIASSGSKRMNQLELYIVRDCVTCWRALRQVWRVARRFPELETQIIDLDRPRRPIPKEIFAAPTLRLGGRIISLGTPDPETLTRHIRDHLARTGAPHALNPDSL